MAKTILQEIQQSRPFPTASEQTLVNLMRTCRMLEEGWMSFLKKSEGISLSQYNVLRILRGAQPGKLKISEISARMINRDPDVTRLVDRLVKQGLAQRVRDTGDRRVVFVSISEAGMELLNRLADPINRYADSVMAGLSAQRLRELETLLDQLRAGVQQFP